MTVSRKGAAPRPGDGVDFPITMSFRKGNVTGSEEDFLPGVRQEILRPRENGVDPERVHFGDQHAHVYGKRTSPALRSSEPGGFFDFTKSPNFRLIMLTVDSTLTADGNGGVFFLRWRYNAPMPSDRKPSLIETMKNRILVGCVLILAAGCEQKADEPPKNPAGAAPAIHHEQPKDDSDSPLVKEARPDTEATLRGLLSGEYDEDRDYARVAAKVKGYDSWTIERQEIDHGNPRAVNFSGILKGAKGEAAFTASMVRQHNGKWMIGYFNGPYPK